MFGIRTITDDPGEVVRMQLPSKPHPFRQQQKHREPRLVEGQIASTPPQRKASTVAPSGVRTVWAQSLGR